jgi:hypothetical protein
MPGVERFAAGLCARTAKRHGSAEQRRDDP